MADVITTFSVLSNDAPNVWIAQQMYALAEKQMILGRFATKFQLPQRFGKTLRVVRYKRINLPTTTLTEGVPPDAVALATENVDIAAEQWGIVVLLTDVAEITTKHPALQIAINRTSLLVTETLEREMARMLLGGTNVFFPGSVVTARSGLAATDKISTAAILKTTANLRTSGAPTFENDLYYGAIPPQAEADVLGSDSTFQTAMAQAGNLRPLDYAEIGVWMGVRWYRSNFLPIFRGEVAPDAAVNTAVKAQLTGNVTTAVYTAAATVPVVTVARDVTTDYERRISQTASFALGAGNTGLLVKTPTSTNYVYDIYVGDAVGGGTARLSGVRIAANTNYQVPALPASTQPTASVAPAAGVEVFVSWVVGRDGYGRVELSGMSMQSFLTPPSASWANPIMQGRKIGSKIMWKSFLLDNNYLARLESGSAFSANLPA